MTENGEPDVVATVTIRFLSDGNARVDLDRAGIVHLFAAAKLAEINGIALFVQKSQEAARRSQIVRAVPGPADLKRT